MEGSKKWIAGTAALAEYLDLSESTVKNYIRAGFLPMRKLGRKSMFLVDEIDAAISEPVNHG